MKADEVLLVSYGIVHTIQDVNSVLFKASDDDLVKYLRDQCAVSIYADEYNLENTKITHRDDEKRIVVVPRKR